MSRSKHKPMSPEQVIKKAAERRAKEFEAVGLQGEAAKLTAQEDVTITRQGDTNAEGKKVRENQILRMDAFHCLRDSLCDGGYDTVREFERQLTIRAGEHDRGRNLERVDCSTGGGRIDAMVAAATHVARITGQLSDRTHWLLTELLDPSVQTRIQTNTWRGVVAHITGATNPVAQAERVKVAVEELVDAYAKACVDPKARKVVA